MAKEIFQDVIPPGKKSIRRIPLKRQKSAPISPREKAVVRKAVETPPEEERVEEEQPVPMRQKPQASYEYPPKRRFSKLLLGSVIGIVSIALVVFLVTTFAASATIKLIAHQETSSLDSDFIGQENPGKDGIGFKTVAVSEDSNEIVKASGQVDAKKKASGTVILYNNFSTAPQKLIRNTRVSTAEGLIFRIDSSVTIPGKSTSAGKVIPGSVAVLVYADSPGEEYNIGLTDFTIPGFKGTAKYKDFYGRSKTVMQGGIVGKINTITDKERALAVERIETRAVSELLSQANIQKPDDFVLFSNSYAATFSNLPDEQLGGNSLKLKVHTDIKAVVYNENALGKLIAQKTIKDFDGSDIIILNMDTLAFEAKKVDPKHPFEVGTIPFHLKGQPKIQWVFDTDKIKNEIAGKPRADLQNILAAQHGIDKAEITVNPFWLRSFPSDTSKITIEEH